MVKLQKKKHHAIIDNYEHVTPNFVSQEAEETDAEEEGEVEVIPESEKSKFLEVPLKQLKNKTLNIASQLFSLFTIIQFPNSKCVANSTTASYEGTCYHATQCAKLNGTAMGNCAQGYGVCCVCTYFFFLTW